MLSLPPGPKRWPFLGSAFHMPKHYAWRTFSKWKEIYGNIIYLDVLGTPIVVINSASAARDLMDKRSSIYSDRPRPVTGLDQTFPLKQYGEAWRTQRRLISQYLVPSAMPEHHMIQGEEARKFVLRVMSNRDLHWTSKSLRKQVELGIAASIFNVTYGYPLNSTDDTFLRQSTHVMDDFCKTAEAGVWIVDMIPQLKYMPSWMPGSGFLKIARDLRSNYEAVMKNLFQWTKDNLNNETAIPSICSAALSSNLSPSQELEEQLSFAAFSALAGGLDTNISTFLSFIFVMTLHPEIQTKARAEIDNCVGNLRLPTLDDKESLPFVRSVITEVMRLYPPTPLGFPHSLQQDDVYNDMFLPKKSIIFPNVWYMLRDPEVFDKPEIFNPSRYGGLDSEMQKVTDTTFGFGRRVCPGRYFAENTIFAIVATLLATCEILPPSDSTGKECKSEVPVAGTGTIA
ncbi:cytochrome P450 [Dendrothele bispora CBS 962.96]|uniref:Cytochrome P450 n=1 Tax=Dendrothele bispora (strain CBS 962.96) TaxID=1314807 RepID=A0A4S8LB78_DENBC|nr:cytochrome P450 [Dendrothele bispora CBS 962.96]